MVENCKFVKIRMRFFVVMAATHRHTNIMCLGTPQQTHPYGTRSKTQANSILQSPSEDEAEPSLTLEPSLEDTKNPGVRGNLINCLSTKLWQ